MDRISTHLRSNVVGYVALFVALSGTAYAIDGPLAGQNTVGEQDIINNEVYSADVRNDTQANGGLAAADLRAGSVGGSEVINNSLSGADIAEGSLNGVDAETLDGVDSTDFIRGKGRLLTSQTSASVFQTVAVMELAGFFQIYFVCGNGSGFNNIAYRSQSSSAIEVYFDNGTSDPERRLIAGGDTTTFSNNASLAGELNTFQVTAPDGEAVTAWVTSAWRGSDCLVNSHAIHTQP